MLSGHYTKFLEIFTYTACWGIVAAIIAYIIPSTQETLRIALLVGCCIILRFFLKTYVFKVQEL